MLPSVRIAAGMAATLALSGIASANVPDPVTSAKPLDVRVHYDAKRKTYCIADPNAVTTGTILPRTACKTQDQWAEEGVRITRR